MLKGYIKASKEEIAKDTVDIDWNDDWGDEPVDDEARHEIILERLNIAPNLIPICGHRYISECDSEFSPVISVVGTDVIYYSYYLTGFLSEETVPEGALLSDFTYIPFWTDIM